MKIGLIVGGILLIALVLSVVIYRSFKPHDVVTVYDSGWIAVDADNCTVQREKGFMIIQCR